MPFKTKYSIKVLMPKCISDKFMGFSQKNVETHHK